MTKNKLLDLNNHLFEALERINDDELQGEKLQEEMARAKTITQIGNTIINNASLALEAKKYKDEFGRGATLPLMIENAK
jgi:phage protein